MRLVWGEIRPAEDIPDFGAAFKKRMEEKRDPQLRAASLTAWRLLARELKSMGIPLPTVAYTENGKPYFLDFSLSFPDFSLHNSNFSLNYDNNAAFSSNFSLFFSLSHSAQLAAALISDRPCGVDLQIVRPEISEKLYARCMHPQEIAAEMDFFEAWTKKECLAKLTGAGLPSHPCKINTSEYENWHTQKLWDASGNSYLLSAICAP